MFWVSYNGSPPQAWGQRCLPALALGRSRLTPTGVGTTEINRYLSCHKHGSPPQAWGQRSELIRGNSGITAHPHRRGDNEFTLPSPTTTTTAHPHRRGDNSDNRGWNHRSNCGSPPQAWGQRTTRNGKRIGSTGSPPQAWGQRSEQADELSRVAAHPHRRGDNLQLIPVHD